MSLKKAYTPPTIKVSCIRLTHSLTAGLHNVAPVNNKQYSTDDDVHREDDFDTVY